MRLTEILDYYNSDKPRRVSLYSHFVPTADDEKRRRKYKKARKQWALVGPAVEVESKKTRRRVMKDIFP